MYAIVKTGGKQYKVAAGDVLSIEKLEAEPGERVELPVLCVVDGANVEFDAEKAAATTVSAEVLEQYRGKKQMVFKFKKRKNYKKLRGHRQQLTRVRIMSVGPDTYKAPSKDAAGKQAGQAKAAVDAAASEDAE